MCGRYRLAGDDDRDVSGRFGLPNGPPRELLGRANVAPSEPVLAIGPGGTVVPARWGLAPPREGARPLINARAETLVAKPLFARGERVLVPADGWYEWLRAEDGRRARPQPFLHTVDGGTLVAFAGVVRDGGLAVLTCAANEACARLHDRMPVVLAGPAEERAWLDGPLDDALVGAVCAPLPAGRVTIAAADAGAVNRAGPPPAPAPQLSLFGA
jgi:putative SOS response-associated peptidase YedK